MKLYNNISLIFSIWLASVIFVSFIGFSSLPHSGRFTDNFFQSFSNWDGGHFLGIAQYGYREKYQYAFFPLYPLTIRGLNQIFNNFQVTGFLISIISAFLGIQLLYKLVAIEFDRRIAEKVILALLFFPASFFFVMFYSEGLFFFLVVATFYNLLQRKLFFAVVLASLASATRLAGLALVSGLIVEVMMTKGVNRKNWYVLLSPLGFLIYCWYLYTQTGDPFYFITAENHWQRSLSIPGLNFWETIRNLTNSEFIQTHIGSFLDLLFAAFGLGLVLRAFRFLTPSYCIYGLVSLLLPLFTPQLSSMPRFLLPIFPIFILIALVRNQYGMLVYQIISLMLLSYFVVSFVTGYWVS